MFPLAQYINQRLDKNKSVNITFLGDSITSAEWIHPNFREIVEYVLKEEFSETYQWKIPSWNIRTFNCGYDGSTTKDILNRLDSSILPLDTNVLFYEIGVNDSALNISIEEFNENIDKILQKLLSIEEIYIMTAPYTLNECINERYQPYIEEIEKISPKYKLEIVDLNKLFKKLNLQEIYTFKTEENTIEGYTEGDLDPEHPNVLGNLYIAKYILETFDIQFSPEKYIIDLEKGLKYPQY